VLNQFINIQNKFLTPPHQEIQDHHAEVPFKIEDTIIKSVARIKNHLSNDIARDVLEILTRQAPKKITIKTICKELKISFFRYQQSEHAIKLAIKKMTKD